MYYGGGYDMYVDSSCRNAYFGSCSYNYMTPIYNYCTYSFFSE